MPSYEVREINPGCDYTTNGYTLNYGNSIYYSGTSTTGYPSYYYNPIIEREDRGELFKSFPENPKTYSGHLPTYNTDQIKAGQFWECVPINTRLLITHISPLTGLITVMNELGQSEEVSEYFLRSFCNLINTMKELQINDLFDPYVVIEEDFK